MKKQVILILMSLITLTGCAKKTVAEPPTAGNDKSVVYMTQEISPAALVRIYEALERPAEGRVAVKKADTTTSSPNSFASWLIR